MKLLRVKIVKTDTCGGLLNGLEVNFNSSKMAADRNQASAFCLVGPNGSGKSQFLQIICEIFQTVFHTAIPLEERTSCNKTVEFELEYSIKPIEADKNYHVRIIRRKEGDRKLNFTLAIFEEEVWIDVSIDKWKLYLPDKIVGYTSGDNETLSLPFLLSRSKYAEAVGEQAIKDSFNENKVPETRLTHIDYGTHLEVLVSNLLFGTREQIKYLLADLKVKNLSSFRIVIQLNHPVAPKSRLMPTGRPGVQLTVELFNYIENLKKCCTCYDHNEKLETYKFDFLVTDATRKLFKEYWINATDLYSSFHKLAMLNDLIIPDQTKDRIIRDAEKRRFASKLPEPFEEHKIFRFEHVLFSKDLNEDDVDYVSLSDGEHQLAQILGVFSMMTATNTLFILDEPESHFNPEWRVNFISKIRSIPGFANIEKSSNPSQEILLTTHTPFVPSDLPRDQILIFKKEDGSIQVNRPEVETYGTSFDTILAECFNIRPPISNLSKDEIEAMMKSRDKKKIRACIDKLGSSVKKLLLKDRLALLEREGTEK